MGFFQANTLWCDKQYYLHQDTGQYMTKYVLVLATSADGDDALSAVLTSKSHGLRESPACDPGPPRAGYFLGVPGGVLQKPTWVDFSSIENQDAYVFRRRVAANRVSSVGTLLNPAVFCGVLRCLSRSEDLNGRQYKWLRSTIDALQCAPQR